jgi:hypothetical protein
MFGIVNIAHAQSAQNPVVTRIIAKLADEILNPAIMLMFAIAIVVFLWGLFQFIYHADDPGAREDAKQHILWGVIGMFIMVSAYGIIYLTLNTVEVPIPQTLQRP